MNNHYLVIANAGDWCGNYIPYSYCATIEDAFYFAHKAVQTDKQWARIINLITMKDECVRIQKSSVSNAIHVVWDEFYETEDGQIRRTDASAGEYTKLTITIDLIPADSFAERIKRRLNCL